MGLVFLCCVVFFSCLCSFIVFLNSKNSLLKIRIRFCLEKVCLNRLNKGCVSVMIYVIDVRSFSCISSVSVRLIICVWLC